MKHALLIAICMVSTANAADIVSIFHDARNQDPVFSAAKSAFDAAQEKIPQGKSLLLPSLNLAANTTYNKNDTQFRTAIAGLPAGQRNFNSSGYTLSISQPIFQMQNFIQYGQAELEVVQARAQFSQASQDLIIRSAQSYFDALLAQNNVELVQAQKSAITEQLEQARRNFEAGTATITDTHEAQARFDLVSSQEIAAQSDLEIKMRSLETLTGHLPGNLDALGEHFELTGPEPANVDQWVDAALKGNLQIAGAEAFFQMAQKEVEKNRAGHYPTLNLVGNYGQNSATGSIYFPAGYDMKSSAIGLQLNLPLYQGGLVSAKVREAVANLEKSRQDLEGAKRSASLNARQAFLGVANGMAQVKALEAALVSSQSMLESTKLGQEVGVRTSVDVLNAQQQYYSARRDLYQAKYAFLLSELKLKAATGSLTEADLEQINRSLH